MTRKKITTGSVIRQFAKYVIGNYGRLPVVIVRGKGCYVWDADGKKYSPRGKTKAGVPYVKYGHLSDSTDYFFTEAFARWYD